MTIELIMNIWIFVCALFGMVYGFRNFFRPRKALYLKIITCGVASLMFAILFQVIFLVTQGSLNEGFHIGYLGVTGSFMFFFTANFGQIDGLVDDKSKTFRGTRIKALAAPLVFNALYMIFFFLVESPALRIAVGWVTAFIIPCSYYNFKHVIIYDVELGLISQLRKYNMLVLAYAVLTMLAYIGQYGKILPLYIVSCIGIGVVAALMLPVLKRGVDKWIM